MKMRYFTPLPFVLFAAAGLAGCIETDIPPVGSYSEVLVVTEDGAGGQLAAELASHLSRPLNFYVSEDTQFKVAHMQAAQLTQVPYVKNIVICGVASPLSSVGRQIMTQIGPAAVEKVKAGEANVFKKEDLPGPGQLTIVVTAATDEELFALLAERGGDINAALEESCRARLRKYLLKSKNSNLTRSLHEKYGFIIEVPVLYRLLSDESSPPGIELLRDGPARSLGIFWLDWDFRPTLKDSLTLYHARADYVHVRYDGDMMDSTRVRFSHSRLGEYPAIKMEGYWSNSRAVAGGYYQTFFVHDERNRLLWAVDLLVFAPGLPKHPHFRELLALAETFRYN